ncbi:MAG: hypothetical protein J1E16_01080 [Muribaculaceae bacterium]|nr:hypothetical protein [Muribaculaceae bacterium]
MAKYYSQNAGTDSSRGLKPKKRNPWITALKVFCWCIGVLVVLAGIALWIISYHVSPAYVTRLIEDEAAKYLKADLKIGKLDYKLFHSYPWLQFEIDSLTVISKSLEGLDPQLLDSLPPNSYFLASVATVKGQVNVHSLLHDKLKLRDIEIEQPKVNIVIVNDSVSNFNIAPPLPKKTKIPEIDISEVRVSAPIDLDFFSLQNDVTAKVEVESFYLTGGKEKNYTIGFEGIVDGRYRDFSLPAKVPVKFKSGVLMDLPSLSVKLYDLTLALAGLALDIKGEAYANQNGIDLQNAEINVRIDDIFTLLTYLPQQILELVTLPQGLSGILPLDLTLSLLSPFHMDKSSVNQLSFENMPPVKASVKINDANLVYMPPKEKRVEADDVYLETICNFDPKNTDENEIFIKELRLNGEGISMAGTATLNNLLGEVQDFDGKVSFSSTLMKSLSYLIPNSGIKIAGLLKGDVKFEGKALNLGKDGFKDLELSGDLVCHTLDLKSPTTGKVKVKNLKSDYKAQIPEYPLSNYQGTKLAFDFNADTLSTISSGINVLIADLKMNLDAMDTVAGTPDPSGTLLMKAGNFAFKEGATSFNATNISLNARGKLNSNGSSGNYTTVNATTPGEDALIASRISHTPLVLEYSGGGILQTAMNLLTLDADMSMDAGNFQSPDYLYPVKLSNIGISSDLNKVEFTAGKINLANTSFSMGGEVIGLKPFMTNYSATPLQASVDIDFANVNINQLAWGYYGAQLAQGENKDSVFYVPPMTPFTAGDSICVAIPRNIDANIRLRSQSAEYMEYTFSPLSTDIIVKNGAATLSKLTVGAPYCTAVVDWTYSTTRLENIFMDLNANVKDFNFSPFYKVFPSLVKKTPEIQDFTGEINAIIDCHFQMYPDMFMDSESLKANFEIKGSDLQFARQGKIEKITHLMLIEGDEPIRIHNMDITGGFHDNLLQINPFKIQFAGYQLGIAGVNNTAGDMYYHLALEKSPFHLPFGVSLTGKFKHPEVKLGGTHINDYKAEMVSMDPAAKLNVNIMAYLKHGWLLFVQEAARYEGGIKE